MYQINFDAKDEVLHFRIHGFWSMDTVKRFGEDAFAAGAKIRERHDGFAILTDARDCMVHSLDVATGLSELSLRSAAMNPAPNANVAGSALAAIQGKRILTPTNYRVFMDYGEAMAWIDAAWVKRRRA